MEHLTLPVLDADESSVVSHEVLEVERLQDGGVRLLHSPAFVRGIAAGDVIDVLPAELAGFRVRSRAGNVAIVVALQDVADKSSDLVRRLVANVISLGGVCEGGPGRALAFTIPVTAGFGQIESAFSSLGAGGDGASWWYANVLDRDDRPLGWWEARSSGPTDR
ncbi:MAG: DUF4265 domain-containing protein [Gemmatimonadaceae bacterium]